MPTGRNAIQDQLDSFSIRATLFERLFLDLAYACMLDVVISANKANTAGLLIFNLKIEVLPLPCPDIFYSQDDMDHPVHYEALSRRGNGNERHPPRLRATQIETFQHQVSSIPPRIKASGLRTPLDRQTSLSLR
jgi:hypothetical protein